MSTISWNGEYFILTSGNNSSGNQFIYAHSYDGINWIKSEFPSNITANYPYSVKYLGDAYAIVGDLVSTLTNQNGTPVSQNCVVDIVDQSNSVAITNNLPSNTTVYDIESNAEQQNRIVFPRSVAIALGNGNKIAYTLDQGSNWKNASNSSSIFSDAKDTVWNGHLWVAVGSGTGNTIATSLDGDVWAGRGNYVFSSSCNGIDWNPQQNKFTAIGSGPNILATSYDGVHWLGTNASLFTVGNDVKSNGSIWVAVGTPIGGHGTIAYSSDGVSWQYSATSFDQAGLKLYFDGTVWTAFGQDTTYNLATSLDGIHWTLSHSDSANALMLNLPTGLFPDASTNIYPGIPYPLRSVDASKIPAVSKYVDNNSTRGHASIQPISIACGEGSASLAYSVDGIQWTAIQNEIFTVCNKVVWTGMVWVAVGAGPLHSIATSYDGIAWTASTSALFAECYDVAYNGYWIVAVGRDSASQPIIARSQDGMSWESVAQSVFSTKVHAIQWTGVSWLAYGSGTNTTAISNHADASALTATATPNLSVTDCANIVAGNNLYENSSSNKIGYNPTNAFDGSFNSNATEWRSLGVNYSGGSYVGSSTTTYNSDQNADGEWLEVQLSAAAFCQHYYVVFSVDSSNSIPKSWKLLGSNDNENWALLDDFQFSASSPPNNSWKYPYSCVPLEVSTNAASYSCYRIVFTSNFGADYVSVAELVLFDAGAQVLDQRVRPILLKDCILHPTRILSVDGVVPNIYRVTDLSGNFLRDGYIHGQYANNTMYGLTSDTTAAAFDGLTHVVASKVGELCFLSNENSVTNLNFDNSLNGIQLQSGISGPINAACYNRKFLLLGGTSGKITYGVLNSNVAPIFYNTNASSLFTTVCGLASNSGYGFVVPPNTIHLKADDRLSVITPKYYDSAISPETTITFNVYKST